MWVAMQDWTFLTNHAVVLVCIARDQRTRLRDIAECAGITERAAQSLVGDLCEAGYISRHRVGTRNFYEVHPDLPLRHPIAQEVEAGELLGLFLRRKQETQEAA